MMDVVQTHVIPSAMSVDPDVLNAICSLGCFKEKERLIQELLSPKYANVKAKTCGQVNNIFSCTFLATILKKSFTFCCWSENEGVQPLKMMTKQ